MKIFGDYFYWDVDNCDGTYRGMNDEEVNTFLDIRSVMSFDAKVDLVNISAGLYEEEKDERYINFVNYMENKYYDRFVNKYREQTGITLRGRTNECARRHFVGELNKKLWNRNDYTKYLKIIGMLDED